MSASERGEQWYGGPGRASRASGTTAGTGAACHHRVGPVWCGPDGRMGRPPLDDDPEWSWRRALAAPQACAHAVDPPTPTPDRHHRSTDLGNAGGCLPRRLRPGPRLPRHHHAAGRAASCPAAGPVPASSALAMLVWVLAVAAGAALLVAGTNRLALAVASVRERRRPIAGDAGDGRPVRRDRRGGWRRAARRTADPGARHRAIRGRHRPRARGSRPAAPGRPGLGDADPRRVGPDGGPARWRGARRRARPTLADQRRPRLRRPRLRCPGHARHGDPRARRFAR